MSNPTSTICYYSKKLIQLNKLYQNEDKFDKIEYKFIFILSIFYNKCQLVGLSLDNDLRIPLLY